MQQKQQITPTGLQYLADLVQCTEWETMVYAAARRKREISVVSKAYARASRPYMQGKCAAELQVQFERTNRLLMEGREGTL
jgi:hypothetical protein